MSQKPAQGTSRVTNIIFRTPHEGLSGLTLANCVHLPGKRVTAMRSLDDTLAITHGERPGAPPPTCDWQGLGGGESPDFPYIRVSVSALNLFFTLISFNTTNSLYSIQQITSSFTDILQSKSITISRWRPPFSASCPSPLAFSAASVMPTGFSLVPQPRLINFITVVASPAASPSIMARDDSAGQPVINALTTMQTNANACHTKWSKWSLIPLQKYSN